MTIDASNPLKWGIQVAFASDHVRRPTGLYLSPGEWATVTPNPFHPKPQPPNSQKSTEPEEYTELGSILNQVTVPEAVVEHGGFQILVGGQTVTLHPTPYTLHPTPYTLHPSHYTLHP